MMLGEKIVVIGCKMISIYDIAKEAGVSATTVSRVLNNKSASAKTRSKVLKIVERLGYIPDGRASSLKTKTNRTIGVIVPDISNPVYPTGVRLIHDLAKEKGYHLILGNTYGRVDEELEILQMMARERVAGLILATCEGEDDSSCYPYLNKMVESGVFLVLSGKKSDGLKVDEITVDNVKGAYKATSYLLRIGRKRIAFMAGRRELLSTEGRLGGYLHALSEKGIDKNEKLISFGGWTRASGESQMENLLKSGEKVDAVFCGNDLLAIGAMETIEKSGPKVPDDIAVVGFDDIELASLIRPKLTTIRQPLEKIAGLGCEILLQRIQGKLLEEPKKILIDPELIVRETA